MALSPEKPSENPSDAPPECTETLADLFRPESKLAEHLLRAQEDPGAPEVQNLGPVTQATMLLRAVEKAEDAFAHVHRRSIFGIARDILIPQRRKYVAEREEEGTQLILLTEALQQSLRERFPDPRTGGVPDEEKAAKNAEILRQIYAAFPEGASLPEPEEKAFRLLTLALLGERSKPAELLQPYIREQLSDDEAVLAHTLAHTTLTRMKHLKEMTGPHEELSNLYNRLRALCVAIEETAPVDLKPRYKKYYASHVL